MWHPVFVDVEAEQDDGDEDVDGEAEEDDEDVIGNIIRDENCRSSKGAD